MTYASIQVFEPIFSLIDFREIRGASAYYVILIQNGQAHFKNIKDSAKKFLKDITSTKLKKGRDELLEKGFIAQIVLDTMPDHQMYLPVNPVQVFGENKQKMMDKFKFTDSQIESRKEHIDDLKKYFDLNFKENGFATESDTTVRYSKDWLLRTIISNVSADTKLAMMLSGLGSFTPPYCEYYKRMLESNLTMKALFQEGDDNRIRIAQNMKSKYPNQIEIKLSATNHVTTRRVLIGNRIAIDARKILPENRPEPSYIGTIYLQKDIIEYIRKNFEVVWDKSKSIEIASN